MGFLISLNLVPSNYIFFNRPNCEIPFSTRISFCYGFICFFFFYISHESANRLLLNPCTIDLFGLFVLFSYCCHHLLQEIIYLCFKQDLIIGFRFIVRLQSLFKFLFYYF